MNTQESMDWLADNGIQVKAQNEGTNSAGGYLVPEEMSSDIIDLREEYGVFRQHTRVHQMASDHTVIPRRSGGLTAYAVGESDSITESEKSWDQVALTAKKWATLTRYTSEVDEDAERTPLGRRIVFDDCVRAASNRLRIRDLLLRHPEIHDLEIARPIGVVGLPRSGTTHLVNLIAADQRLRSMPLCALNSSTGSYLARLHLANALKGPPAKPS